MKKKKPDTKQIILDTALELFSKKGYKAISIRDICGQIGIKESAIYYHFKNKQEIFDVLCQSFEDVTYAMPKEFAVEMAKVTSVRKEEFFMVCFSFLNDYLMAEHVNKFIRMLIIEQGTNSYTAGLYHKILFDEAISGQIIIFKWLIDIGFLIDTEVKGMVMDYYATVFYLFHRYLISGEITDEIKTRVNEELLQHLEHFLHKYSAVREDK
jgi:AcrR family transcriptional regulator